MSTVSDSHVPRWIRELRQQCDDKTQAAVAKEIGYSSTVVNQVLRGCYVGDMEKVERAVRGAYLGETVHCPGMGDELETHRCLEWQRKPFSPANTQNVRMFRHCHGTCPNAEQNRRKP